MRQRFKVKTFMKKFNRFKNGMIFQLLFSTVLPLTCYLWIFRSSSEVRARGSVEKSVGSGLCRVRNITCHIPVHRTLLFIRTNYHSVYHISNKSATQRNR